MTDLDIETVLEYNLYNLLDGLGIDFVPPNTEYVPTEGKMYVRPDLVPARPTAVGISSNSKNRHTGFYQIRISAPINEGKGKVQTVVDSLKSTFTRGTRLTAPGISFAVRCLRFSIELYIEGEDRFTQFVRIEYRADLENN